MNNVVRLDDLMNEIMKHKVKFTCEWNDEPGCLDLTIKDQDIQFEGSFLVDPENHLNGPCGQIIVSDYKINALFNWLDLIQLLNNIFDAMEIILK